MSSTSPTSVLPSCVVCDGHLQGVLAEKQQALRFNGQFLCEDEVQAPECVGPYDSREEGEGGSESGIYGASRLHFVTPRLHKT